MQEEWKNIQGYEGKYMISNLGNVKSLKRKVWNGKGYFIKEEKILKPNKTQKGYLQVELQSKPFSIHRLVANEFLVNEENKPQINHKNGIKTDNKLENLEFCTNSENQLHAYKIGLIKSRKGIEHHLAKQIFMYNLDGELIKKFEYINQATNWLKENGFPKAKNSNLSLVANGKRNKAYGYKWRWC